MLSFPLEGHIKTWLTHSQFYDYSYPILVRLKEYCLFYLAYEKNEYYVIVEFGDSLLAINHWLIFCSSLLIVRNKAFKHFCLNKTDCYRKRTW